MVEPQFFFSALAQSSAAVVGFIVAVAAALYSLERQKVEKRTDGYRDALTKLRNRYEFPLRSLAAMLENQGAESTEEMLELTRNGDELESIAREESEEYPVTSLFLAHVERIRLLLSRVEPENDNILTAGELGALKESVEWFHHHFFQINSTSKAVVEEVTGIPLSEFDNMNAIRLFKRSGELEGFNAFLLKEWFEERKEVKSEAMRPNYDSWEVNEDDFITGDNFWTLKALAEYLTRDFREVSKESSGTVIRYESGIRPVVKVSTYMILIGVFLPMAFLFSSPITLPVWAILGSQIVLLGAALLLSLTLVEIVVRSAGTSNQMGDIENLSKYSSVIVRKLPELPT